MAEARRKLPADQERLIERELVEAARRTREKRRQEAEEEKPPMRVYEIEDYRIERL
jgi:hypothetical protein